MPKPCEGSCSALGGIFVKTYSGHGKQAICSLGALTYIKHVVVIENLMAYPTDIECEGKISSPQQTIQFSSAVAGDTHDRWTARKPRLNQGKHPPIEHVTLLPLMRSGFEIVTTTVTAIRPGRGDSETVTIDIIVSA